MANSLRFPIWIWPLSLAATIFVVSGGQPAGPGNVPYLDKVAHFLIFGLLATLILRTRKSSSWSWTLTALIITSGFGAADEFRQSFTPGRFVEWQDWLADTLGAITAICAYRWLPIYSRILEHKLMTKPRQDNPIENN